MEALFKTVGNYAYIHAELGSDLFGDGSIEKPYASHAKANTLGKAKILRGALIENGCFNVRGDEKWQFIAGSNLSNCANIRADLLASGNTDCIVRSFERTAGSPQQRCVSTEYSGDVGRGVNSTGAYRNASFIFANCIVYTEFIIGTATHYCLMPSTCVFKYNNTVYSAQWVNDSFENVRLLKKAIDPTWSEFGSNTILDTAFGTININGQKIETCQIVKERKDGGVLPNIFSEYENDNVTPKSFYLNPDPQNVALHASETGDYVGALPPAEISTFNNQFLNVNPTTGIASAQVGNIFKYDSESDLITNNNPSAFAGQTWNRYTSAIIELQKYAAFEGVNNFGFASAQTSGIYIGKRQNLFGAEIVPKSSVFTLEPNKRYKVFDTSNELNIDSGIVVKENGKVDIIVTRNNIFCTPNTITATYMARTSNVTLREVINTPCESLEVIPYDSLNVPSAFPRFSSPVNDSVLMLYHKTGAKTGEPVRFADIVHDKIAYYNEFAVTNADKEYYTLLADSANYEAKKVFLRYCKIETNVIYDSNLRV